MALLDRVRDRIETDLDDGEVQLLIDEANQDIISRFGPHANPAAPITVTVDASRRRSIDIIRPIDTAHPVVISETRYGDTAELVDADYRVLNGGRTLQRVMEGLSSYAWGETVDVTYTPVADGNQRQEVIIGLVQLAVERLGVKSRKAGDLTTEFVDYSAEREKLLKSLAPRRGLFCR